MTPVKPKVYLPTKPAPESILSAEEVELETTASAIMEHKLRIGAGSFYQVEKPSRKEWHDIMIIWLKSKFRPETNTRLRNSLDTLLKNPHNKA